MESYVSDKEDLSRAITIAVSAHDGHYGKDGLPYILHPIHLMNQFTNFNTMIVAVLHDVVEDTSWTLEDLEREGFNDHVIKCLDLLTHKEEDSYEKYIDRIRRSMSVVPILVKMADLKHNMDQSRILSPMTQKDVDRLNRYKLAYRELSDTGV